MKRGGQQDRKSRRNLLQNYSKLSNDRLWWNIRPTLGPIIFGTKRDRDNTICFLQKEGDNGIELSHKMTRHDWKMSKTGVNHREFPYHLHRGQNGNIQHYFFVNPPPPSTATPPFQFGQHRIVGLPCNPDYPRSSTPPLNPQQMYLWINMYIFYLCVARGL